MDGENTTVVVQRYLDKLAMAARAIRPQSATAFSTLAYYLRERGDLAAAVVAADRAIEIDPKYVSAHHYRGLALRDKKDLPGAIAAF